MSKVDLDEIEKLTEAQQESYAVLISMGFDELAALKAVQKYDTNIERAAEFCLDFKPEAEKPKIKPPPEKKDEPEPSNVSTELYELKVDVDEVLKSRLVHKAAWFNDVSSINSYSKLGEPKIFNLIDHRGNTPLSLAARLGNWDTVHALLDRGNADPRLVLPSGWTAIHEAILAKNERALTNMIIHRIQHKIQEYEKERRFIIEKLKKCPDFSIEIHWAVRSWIPAALINTLMSKFTSTDASNMEPFRIYKVGANIRFDSKIRGITGTGISKGFLTFLHTEKSMVLIDHDHELIEDALRKLRRPDINQIQRKIDSLLTSEEGISQLSPGNVNFLAQKTWLGSDRTQVVEEIECSAFDMSGLKMETITNGAKETREFDEYFGESESKEPEHQVNAQDVKIDMLVSKEFPLARDDLISVLECIAPASDDITRLLEILKLKFPEGFPVQLNFPIMPGIAVQITFKCFKELKEPGKLFDIPRNYRVNFN